VVSAAYGIFYEPYYTGEGGPLQDPVSSPPYLKTQQISFPVNSFANPFYTPNPFSQAFPEPMTLLVVARNLHLPYAQDWNLNVQHSIGANWLFQIGYVGTTGVRLPRFIEGNPPVFVPGVDTTSTGCSVASPCPISTENNVNQRRLYSGCTLVNPNNCIYSSVGEIASVANSSYNALETSLRKRFSHGLSFLASYTWSHSIDDVSSFNITGSASQLVAGENDLAQDPFDLAAERGRSMFDSHNRFVLSYQWVLPYLAALQQLVWSRSRQLAAERDIHRHERGAVYGIRFERRFAARAGPGDHRIFREPSQSDWKSKLWSAHAAGMVQRKCFSATPAGSSGTFRGIRGRRPERCPGSGIRELGRLRLQEHSAHGIKRTSIPRRTVQFAEPYQLPLAGQRH